VLRAAACRRAWHADSSVVGPPLHDTRQLQPNAHAATFQAWSLISCITDGTFHFFILLRVDKLLCHFPQELCAAVATGALPHLPAAVDALGAEPPELLAPCAAPLPHYHDRTARLVLEQVAWRARSRRSALALALRRMLRGWAAAMLFRKCPPVLRGSQASVPVRAVWALTPNFGQGALTPVGMGTSPPRQRSHAGGDGERGGGAAACRTGRICARGGQHAQPAQQQAHTHGARTRRAGCPAGASVR